MLIELNQSIVTNDNDLKQHIELPEGLQINTINVDYLPLDIKEQQEFFVKRTKKGEYVCIYYKNLFCFIENNDKNFTEIKPKWNLDG